MRRSSSTLSADHERACRRRSTSISAAVGAALTLAGVTTSTSDGADQRAPRSSITTRQNNDIPSSVVARREISIRGGPQSGRGDDHHRGVGGRAGARGRSAGRVTRLGLPDRPAGPTIITGQSRAA